MRIEASQGAFPAGSQLVIEEVDKDHADYGVVLGDLDTDIRNTAERFKFYRIEIHDMNGNKIRPANGNKVKTGLSDPMAITYRRANYRPYKNFGVLKLSENRFR